MIAPSRPGLAAWLSAGLLLGGWPAAAGASLREALPPRLVEPAVPGADAARLPLSAESRAEAAPASAGALTQAQAVLAPLAADADASAASLVWDHAAGGPPAEPADVAPAGSAPSLPRPARRPRMARGVRMALSTAKTVGPATAALAAMVSVPALFVPGAWGLGLPFAVLAAQFGVIGLFWTARQRLYPALSRAGQSAFVAGAQAARALWLAALAGAFGLWLLAAPSNGDAVAAYWTAGLAGWGFTLLELSHHLLFRVRVDNGPGDRGKPGLANRLGGNIGRHLAHLKRRLDATAAR